MRLRRSFHSNSADLATPKLTGLVTRFLYARPQGFLLVDSVAMSVNAPFSAKGKPVSIVFMGFWLYTIISNSFLESNYNYCQITRLQCI